MEIVPVVLVKNDENFLAYSLEASRGFFSRYVIHDINSTDRTRDIIQWFIDSSPGVEFFVKFWPELHPQFQGELRNSSIAEAKSDWILILDADEIYSKESFEKIIESPKYFPGKKVYGVVRRIEVVNNFQQAYGLNKFVGHHRIYHRTCLWRGSHPGEAAITPQNKTTELEFPEIICYHFHNAFRSSKDNEVPRRIERRTQATYHPGELDSIDLLKELPILKNRIQDFPVNPNLRKLWDE